MIVQEKTQASSSANEEIDLDELMDASRRTLFLLVAWYLCIFFNARVYVSFCNARIQS
ncbi:hypothetical protein SOVF_210330 [Spinacia oleracea]|nr:hypothetical protein SOVF_210330 [Spinacia oleracea]